MAKGIIMPNQVFNLVSQRDGNSWETDASGNCILLDSCHLQFPGRQETGACHRLKHMPGRVVEADEVGLPTAVSVQFLQFLYL
jgi:hypothetical protein